MAVKKVWHECSVCGRKYKIWDFLIGKDVFCPDAGDHAKIIREHKISKIPIKTKQKMLDLLHKGKTIGQCQKILKLDLDEACGIIDENIGTYKYLRKEAK